MPFIFYNIKYSILSLKTRMEEGSLCAFLVTLSLRRGSSTKAQAQKCNEDYKLFSLLSILSALPPAIHDMKLKGINTTYRELFL